MLLILFATLYLAGRVSGVFLAVTAIIVEVWYYCICCASWYVTYNAYREFDNLPEIRMAQERSSQYRPPDSVIYDVDI